MLSIKTSVIVKGIQTELLLALTIADQVYQQTAGVPCVITACLDGKHMAGSLHYTGYAADLRTRDMHPGDAQKVVDTLRKLLGRQYDVVLESDHIHLEFDPHTK